MRQFAQLSPLFECIEVSYVGCLGGKADINLARNDLISLTLRTGIKDILMDGSGMIFVADLSEVQNSAAEFLKANVSKQTRFSIVLPILEEPRRAANLFINACNANGWAARGFKSGSAAMAWLRPKSLI